MTELLERLVAEESELQFDRFARVSMPAVEQLRAHLRGRTA
jgi:hypothetical protein